MLYDTHLPSKTEPLLIASCGAGTLPAKAKRIKRRKVLRDFVTGKPTKRKALLKETVEVRAALSTVAASAAVVQASTISQEATAVPPQVEPSAALPLLEQATGKAKTLFVKRHRRKGNPKSSLE